MNILVSFLLASGIILSSPDSRLNVEINSTSASNICYTVTYDFAGYKLVKDAEKISVLSESLHFFECLHLYKPNCSGAA